MITNYDSRNSLEYYNIGAVYAFPVNSTFAGITLSNEEQKNYAGMIATLAADKTVSEVSASYTGSARIPGIVVDKERGSANGHLVVIIRANIDGRVEYQYKKFITDSINGAAADGATMPLMAAYSFAANAAHPQLAPLPAKAAPATQNNVHTGPVEKNSVDNNKHTGPVEKSDASAKHTGPVEKTETASNHTGPVEKTASDESYTGPVEKIESEKRTGPVEKI